MPSIITNNIDLSAFEDSTIISLSFIILICILLLGAYKYYKNENKLHKINQQQTEKISNLEQTLAITNESYRRIAEQLDMQIQRNNILANHLNIIIEHTINELRRQNSNGGNQNAE